MTTHIARPKLWGTQPTQFVLPLIVATSVLLSLAITNQSLWIDEAVMAYFASHSGLVNMFTMVSNLRTSDPQMPLYIVYLWGWAKLLGTSEYALRAANIPFAILFVAALGWTSWRILGQPVLWVVFCFSPFVWFYMNEARPYIAIMACSALSTGAMMAYFADRATYGRTAPWICLSASLVACGLQMLSVFLVSSLVVLALLAARETRLPWNTIWQDWGTALLIHGPLFLALGAYFGWTLSVGAGGARETPGFGNLGFALYEFMGFQGLGPPRHVLRAEHNLQVFIPYWPWLFMGVLTAVALLYVSAFQMIRRKPDYLPTLVGALVSGLTLFLIASTAADFRFWGRHLAAFFPLFSFILIAAIGELARERTWKHIGRMAVFSLLCIWLISDARLWALPKYHKDDYRSAAQATLDAARRSNATILWAANGIAARYYGIEFEQPLEGVDWPSRGKAILAANWSQTQIMEYLDSATGPVVLVLSKTDLYDAAGAWTASVNKLRPLKIASPNTFNIYLFENGPHGRSTFEVRGGEG